MTARELWDSMRRGSSFAILSDKQRTFLIDLAKAEKIFTVDGCLISFPDGLKVKIKNANTIVGAYGGGLVKKAINGKFKAEEFFSIRFTSTGLTAFYQQHDLDHFTREGHEYTILK